MLFVPGCASTVCLSGLRFLSRSPIGHCINTISISIVVSCFMIVIVSSTIIIRNHCNCNHKVFQNLCWILLKLT